jgi:undecaprenyl-diphosphatase
VAALAAHLIVPQVTELHQIGHALSRARWDWLAAAAIASTFTYLMAAAAVAGAAGRRLPFGRTVLAQLVSSVANRLTPGGTGGVGVNIRCLQRSGLTTPESVAAVTLVNVAGFIVHVLALAAVAGLLAGRAVEPVRLPHRGAVLIVFLAVTTLAGALFWSPLGRARVLPAARQAAQSLLAALRHPTQAILVLGGAAGVTGSYVLALLCSLRAFGATPPLLDVAAAYLVGTAIGAASPTPAGWVRSQLRSWPSSSTSAFPVSRPSPVCSRSAWSHTGCRYFRASRPPAHCAATGCCEPRRRHIYPADGSNT